MSHCSHPFMRFTVDVADDTQRPDNQTWRVTCGGCDQRLGKHSPPVKDWLYPSWTPPFPQGGLMTDLSYGEIQHTSQPCTDNPQPCGCVVCCCELCQGVCFHMVLEDES